MENQHKLIKGYRELSKEEIDLMNRIKEKGAELLALQAELMGRLDTDAEVKLAGARKSIEGHQYEGRPYNVFNGNTDECHEFRRFEAAEPLRWAALGKTDIQTGIMALVRAVAQPTSC
ncbi:hypothetical protein GPS59_15325 [Acinetobacter haemolyticus]|uniref:Acb2/Tad1 domain-containing protein n=1 Tax=Acinetobacter haemolyticus TaxID=29430 RepID=UPI001372390A|nr:hypothetical protein [Acinetobacter haemolyticus]NAR50128.1 hypothetical protein [Acinetobacter haemolyticus]NAR55311.1 hypothetical protein [Acinetobacter haemolyticus]